jgi:CTP:phosphocholine cytidylyltransferase-like protein/thiamine kinase-like enzyme
MQEVKTKILITTSGLGLRLGELSKYTNKSLIKLGDKAIISHIIDSYPTGDFVITLGYFGEYVQQYLEMAHPDRNFEFVWVDPYEGEGSGLITSMSFAKDKLQCPFIFNVCDTILKSIPPPLTNNWMACGTSLEPDLYRTVCGRDGVITKINEKGEMNYDFAYIGVAGIVDYKLFWETLENVKSYGIKDSSDCHILSGMIHKVNVNLLWVPEWVETGSVQGLKKASQIYERQYDVLDKPEESIFFIGNSVIKFFDDKKICKNRVKRIEKLKGLVPKLLSYSDNFYKYELADGELLANVITEDKIIDLIDFAENNLWLPVEMDNRSFQSKCYEFYHNKTIKRIEDFRKITGIEDKVEIINGILVPELKSILNEGINWYSLIDTTPSGFHGDFILDNILYNGKNKFTLLDWRQDFADNISAGDEYYDLAKLNHNLILNHHILLNNNFVINIETDGVHCDVLRSQNMVNCQEAYMKLLEERGWNINKIKILTALIWINMSPLHSYPLNSFLYYFGKYNLWRELKKK